MLRERLTSLFKSYDPAIQQIVAEVTALEQQHISRKKPRIRSNIDDIITRMAKEELTKLERDSEDPAQ